MTNRYFFNSLVDFANKMVKLRIEAGKVTVTFNSTPGVSEGALRRATVTALIAPTYLCRYNVDEMVENMDLVQWPPQP